MNELKVVQPGDDAKALFGAGDVYRFLITGLESNGQYFVMEAEVMRNGSPLVQRSWTARIPVRSGSD